MPARGDTWDRERKAFKDECKRANTPCWICRGSKGPIQYDARPRTPQSFTVDHVTPTSLGGDPLRRANFKAAHYGCNSSRGNTTRGQFPTSRKW
jgi:5-methylcytosine-specific restriction endonuclease McrA